ncbi:MAG TPA: hypothetical protein VNP96_01815 [Solirubrobacterales bacterium]|nr:hypothetical protein [Solirubrobacterales bacterium]
MQGFSRQARLIRTVCALIAAILVATALSSPAASKPFLHKSQATRSTDFDRDGLGNWVELYRTRTHPRKADTDGDGLRDGVEVRRTRTNPRRADSDGDGIPDGVEIRRGLNPRKANTRAGSPGATAGVLSAPSPQPASSSEPSPSPSDLPPPPPSPPPSGCVEGATDAATAAQVRSAVQAGEDVCIVAGVGNVDLDDLGASPVTISTDGGSMGFVGIDDTTDLTIQSARFRSVELREAHRTRLLGNTIGGSGPSDRESDQLIFMPSESNDVAIEHNDIGWTEADDSGNTGYGCRCYGETNNLRFVANRVHDIAADGFQGSNGSNVLIDRNEIGPVGATPGSDSHSDNIQIVGNGPNLRITNNWIHHQGYYEGTVVGNAGSTYIHGGTSNSVLYENNLIQIARGRTEICGLGTGGTSRSNITVRRNTWVEGGQTFNNFPGFAWECDSGTGNAVERNVAVDPDGGFALTGSSGSATFSDNIWGEPTAVTLDADGNCTSAECNPAGQEPIGYRKPSGVHW